MPNLFAPPAYNVKNPSIRRLERDWLEQFKQDFHAVKEGWLPAVREFIKSETGLTLSRRLNGRAMVTDQGLNFDFVSDSEWNFLQRLDERFPELDFEELIAFRNLAEKGHAAKPFMIGEHKPAQEYIKVMDFLTSYQNQHSVDLVLEELFTNKSSVYDLLGYYSFTEASIKICYIPLILFSRIKKVPLEYCLLITLVHEVAHAFHHLGKDKDGKHWERMSGVDKNVLEGLAQYYTHRFAEEYSKYSTNINKAYENILACQRGPYRTHLDWINNGYTAEHIKQTMIAFRRKNEYKTYEQFLALLKTTLGILG
jgi:hypothetical protein